MASYRIPFQPFLCLSVAFCIHLGFIYIGDEISQNSISQMVAFIFISTLVRSLFSDLVYIVLPDFWSTCSMGIKFLIKRGIVIFLVASFILRPPFPRFHLIAVGLLLISALSFHSLPTTLVESLTALSWVTVFYYFPDMPNFFLSQALIIRRTIASVLLLFLLSTPHLLTIFRMVAAYGLVCLITPKTRLVHYITRKLHQTEYISVEDAEWLVGLLSWSFSTLLVICIIAKNWLHYPPHLKTLILPRYYR